MGGRMGFVCGEPVVIGPGTPQPELDRQVRTILERRRHKAREARKKRPNEG